MKLTEKSVTIVLLSFLLAYLTDSLCYVLIAIAIIWTQLRHIFAVAVMFRINIKSKSPRTSCAPCASESVRRLSRARFQQRCNAAAGSVARSMKGWPHMGGGGSVTWAATVNFFIKGAIKVARQACWYGIFG